MRILGIDPGYAIVGWGAVDYASARFVPVACGAITTPAHTPLTDRLKLIYDELSAVIARYSPQAMSVEKLFFTSNQKTAIDVAQARGVILLCGRLAEVPVFDYTPLQVKQSVVGYGRAEKHQVMEMTRLLLGLKQTPKPDDTADALALAICHAHTSVSQLSEYINQNGQQR